MPAAGKKTPRAQLLSKLGSLENARERENVLSRNKSLLRSESVKQLADLVIEQIRVNTAEGTYQERA